MSKLSLPHHVALCFSVCPCTYSAPTVQATRANIFSLNALPNVRKSYKTSCARRVSVYKPSEKLFTNLGGSVSSVCSSG